MKTNLGMLPEQEKTYREIRKEIARGVREVKRGLDQELERTRNSQSSKRTRPKENGFFQFTLTEYCEYDSNKRHTYIEGRNNILKIIISMAKRLIDSPDFLTLRIRDLRARKSKTSRKKQGHYNNKISEVFYKNTRLPKQIKNKAREIKPTDNLNEKGPFKDFKLVLKRAGIEDYESWLSSIITPPEEFMNPGRGGSSRCEKRTGYSKTVHKYSF